MICHAGDIIDDGSPEQMTEAARLFRQLPCPVYATPGNHDLLKPSAEILLPKHLPELFPDGKVDYFIIRDGVRFDFLTTNWFPGTPYRWQWTWPVRQESYFTGQQMALLKEGPQDLPRILITHSPSAGVPVGQTGLDQEFHAPDESLAQTLSELAEQLKIRLFLGGHTHVNMAVDDGRMAAVTVSSLRELPFELKVFEINQGHVSMQTVSLTNEGADSFGCQYNYNKTFVQGRLCDRRLEFTF